MHTRPAPFRSKEMVLQSTLVCKWCYRARWFLGCDVRAHKHCKLCCTHTPTPSMNAYTRTCKCKVHIRKHTHTCARTHAMRRTRMRLKRIFDLLEVLLQSTLLTCCCNIRLRMVRTKPSTCANCGNTRRNISWSGLCGLCATEAWDNRRVTAGNTVSGLKKRKAAALGWTRRDVNCVSSPLAPVDISREAKLFLQPGYIAPSTVIAKLEKCLPRLHVDAPLGPITLIEFPCGARSEFSEQALRMGGAVLRIGISTGTTHHPSPPKLHMKHAVHWHVDLDKKVEVSRLYAFFPIFGRGPWHIEVSCPLFTCVHRFLKYPEHD